jgi:hypothetical protein
MLSLRVVVTVYGRWEKPKTFKVARAAILKTVLYHHSIGAISRPQIKAGHVRWQVTVPRRYLLPSFAQLQALKPEDVCVHQCSIYSGRIMEPTFPLQLAHVGISFRTAVAVSYPVVVSKADDTHLFKVGSHYWRRTALLILVSHVLPSQGHDQRRRALIFRRRASTAPSHI